MRASRRTDRYHRAWHRWARFVAQRCILRTVVHSTVRVSVEGEANLEGLEPPFIVISNHSSHLDAPLLVTALPWRITRHVATAVAADYFYRQRWRRTLTSFFFNSYPVERGRGKKREAGLSVTLLRENISLAIFPEGTRSRTGQMGSFKPGVAALARALRVPVLPLALVGAHDAMPPGASWPKKGRLPVKVIIGKPIHARRGESLPDLNERLYNQVWHMLTNQTPYVLVPESAPTAGSATEAAEPGTDARPAADAERSDQRPASADRAAAGDDGAAATSGRKAAGGPNEGSERAPADESEQREAGQAADDDEQPKRKGGWLRRLRSRRREEPAEATTPAESAEVGTPAEAVGDGTAAESAEAATSAGSAGTSTTTDSPAEESGRKTDDHDGAQEAGGRR